MALINCPDCGKSVSDKAKACIHCGFPIQELLNSSSVSEFLPVTEEEMMDCDAQDDSSNEAPVNTSIPEENQDANNKAELMEYIKAAIDLEREVATQKSIIEAYSDDYAEREPELILEEEPEMPKAQQLQIYKSDDSRSILLCLGVVMLFIGFVALVTNHIASVFILLFAVCCCIPYILKKKSISEENKRRHSAYREARHKYDMAVSEVNKRNTEVTREYNENYKLWKENGEENNAVLHKHIEQTQSLLTELYDKGSIYPKYHNLPALTSIYEYLLTGRCRELTGPHGAYNLYEDEVRKDMVISQLNEVIENLEQIKKNQYMLYQQAKKIADDSSVVSNELRNIQGHTFKLTQLASLNTYYASLTAKNTGISAAFHLLNG